MSQYEALIPSTTEASHRISFEKRIAATRSDYCYKTFGRKWQLHAETFLNTCTLYTRVCFCCTVLFVLGPNWDLDLDQDLDWRKVLGQFLGASSISAGTRGATCWSQCGKRQRTRLPGQPSGIWNDNALKCPHQTILGSIALFFFRDDSFFRFPYFWSCERARLLMLESQAGKA